MCWNAEVMLLFDNYCTKLVTVKRVTVIYSAIKWRKNYSQNIKLVIYSMITLSSFINEIFNTWNQSKNTVGAKNHINLIKKTLNVNKIMCTRVKTVWGPNCSIKSSINWKKKCVTPSDKLCLNKWRVKILFEKIFSCLYDVLLTNFTPGWVV